MSLGHGRPLVAALAFVAAQAGFRLAFVCEEAVLPSEESDVAHLGHQGVERSCWIILIEFDLTLWDRGVE